MRESTACTKRSLGSGPGRWIERDQLRKSGRTVRLPLERVIGDQREAADPCAQPRQPARDIGAHREHLPWSRKRVGQHAQRAVLTTVENVARPGWQGCFAIE